MEFAPPVEKRLIGPHLHLVKGDPETAPASPTQSTLTKTPLVSPATPAIKRDTHTLPDAFPVGSLSFGEEEKQFRIIAREHGGGYDIDNIADAYRHQVGEALSGLTGARLLKSFEAFCRSYAARRGPLR